MHFQCNKQFVLKNLKGQLGFLHEKFCTLNTELRQCENTVNGNTPELCYGFMTTVCFLIISIPLLMVSTACS